MNYLLVAIAVTYLAITICIPGLFNIVSIASIMYIVYAFTKWGYTDDNT